MQELEVGFFSAGTRIAGLLRRPDGDAPVPGIVHGPGWLGLKDANLYLRYHEALVGAGFAILVFDYRGTGGSEGDPSLFSPQRQVEDITHAITYLASRPDVEAGRLGIFGSGGTGGGHAIVIAATDPRVRAAVSQVPISNGRDWLRRMRREYEWTEFLERVEADRTMRVLTGEGLMVNPREEIMVPTPERRQSNVKADVDKKVQFEVPLAVATEIMAYRPIDFAPMARNLLVIAVENDVVTPTDHAVAIYDAAPGPKKLLLQHDTTHYAAYEQYGERVAGEIVAWFQQHLIPRSMSLREDTGGRA